MSANPTNMIFPIQEYIFEQSPLVMGKFPLSVLAKCLLPIGPIELSRLGLVQLVVEAHLSQPIVPGHRAQSLVG